MKRVIYEFLTLEDIPSRVHLSFPLPFQELFEERKTSSLRVKNSSCQPYVDDKGGDGGVDGVDGDGDGDGLSLQCLHIPTGCHTLSLYHSIP